MLLRALLAAFLSHLLIAQENGVPVVIDGREVLRVYSSVGQFSAADRAAGIKERIVALAEKRVAVVVSIRPIPAEKAVALVVGPAIIMAVTQIDAESAGVPQEALARQYAGAVQNAIEGYGARHTWLSFVMALSRTLVVWILFCMSAWLLWKVTRWCATRLEHWFQRQAGARGIIGFHLLLWDRGRLALTSVANGLAGILLLFEFSFALSYTFGLFPQTAGISTSLLGDLGHALGSAGLAVVRYLPDGGFVIIVVILAYYVVRLLKFFAQAIERGDMTVASMHPEVAKPTYQLSKLIVMVFALVVVFPYLPGGKSEALKGVSIFLGLLLSLGSSSAISNVLAGLVLTYMRPFHIGDRVKIADTIGDVLERTLLVTRLRTIKNVEVVIPNAAILSNQILNYSALARSRGLILNTTVTIGYDAPWRTVHNLLVCAALNTDGILRNPAPFVLETSLNDYHISYELNAYTDRANEIQDIYSRLHEAIQDSFNRAGVEIMSPAFYALRDGNTVTIPANDRPAGYEPPSFRVKNGDGWW